MSLSPMKWKALGICSGALLMTACGSLMSPAATPIPPSLDKSCEQLSPLQSTSGADVLLWSTETMRKYQLCADQVEELRKAWPK